MSRIPFLFEIGCEDLPPVDMAYIEKEASGKFEKILTEKRIVFTGLLSFVTPRRIAVAVEGISQHQEPVVEKVKGPPESIALKDGKPAPAGIGFAKKQGVAFKDLVLEETPKGKYYCCVKESPGVPVKTLVEGMIKEFLSSFSFPITMCWPGYEVRFPRPIRWVFVKLGKNTINVRIGSLKSSRGSRGHRVFADKSIAIEEVVEYEKNLMHNYVVADPRKRKLQLRKSIERALQRTDGSAVISEKLLDEVNNLIEYPTGVKGQFPEKYLKIPREVIEACLMHHQKYFPVEDNNGDLMNCFVAVRDGISENIAPIRKGYEKVLIARLDDAEFFFNKDRKKKLEDYVPDLSGIEFTRGLGNLSSKVERYAKLAKEISVKLGKGKDFEKTVERIAQLSKADLVTAMVGEFPELEGKVGRIYSEMDGVPAKVSKGIYQHYQPRTFEDQVPKLEEAAVVGVADRVDTLVGNMGTGVEATGSQDPFGMRRAARGLVRILVEKKWDLDLCSVLTRSEEIFKFQNLTFERENITNLINFTAVQIKNYLEENFNHDVVRCAMSNNEMNPYLLFEKAKAVKKIKKSKGFDSLVTAFKRINNILKQAKEKNIVLPAEYDVEKLKEKSEKELSNSFCQASSDVEKMVDGGDFSGALKMLASLREAVDKYFDEVLVMDPDENLMKNRLAMLRNIVELFSPVGDISKLEVK